MSRTVLREREGEVPSRYSPGKNAKRAAVAVARKLSVLLLHLWVTGEVYEPLRNAKRRGELLPTPS